MHSRTAAPALRLLTEVIEALGPINSGEPAELQDKRTSRRPPIVLPVRLRLVSRQDKPAGPAFTARSRDICEQGLGLTIPCRLETAKEYQVEVFTDVGTWIGRMRTTHCAEADTGYIAGLECVEPATSRPCRPEPPTTPRAQTPKPTPVDRRPQPPAILTLEQAREEIRQAIRRYQLARYSWGTFGTRMEQQISRALSTLPPPREARLKLEPRRRTFRYDVAGEVHVVLPLGPEQHLLKTHIADISHGGARLTVSAEDLYQAAPSELDHDQVWGKGTPVVIGLWTDETGTLWLPSHVVHSDDDMMGLLCVGVRFALDRSLREHL